MTLAGLTDNDPADYLDLAAAIADHSSQPDADLAALWRRIAVFTLVHNVDDHFRNHGFLQSPGGWALAPAFDVNPNPDPNKARATGISGIRSVAEERDALLEVAPYFGLTADRGTEVLAQVDTAVASWQTVATTNDILNHETRLFADVFPAPACGGSGGGPTRRSSALQAGALDMPPARHRDAHPLPESIGRPPESPSI